eukprot:14759401-Heterocapsa_arctica.AAC.1
MRSRGRADVDPASEREHQVHELVNLLPLSIGPEAAVLLGLLIETRVQVVDDDARHAQREQVLPVAIR